MFHQLRAATRGVVTAQFGCGTSKRMQRFTAYLAVVYAASALVACSAGGTNSSGSGGAANGGAANGGASNGGSASGGAASGGAANGGAANGGASGGAASGGSASGGAASGGTASGGSASGGAASGGAASGGSAGSGSVELKMPIQRNGKYVLEFGDILFEVDPAVGARVVTFSLGGKNVLTSAADDKSGGGNYGATFWPSPQSAWGTSDWPPIPEIDTQAYTATLDGNTIVMTQGATSARSKLSVVKRFSAVLNAQAIDVQYTLTNKDTVAASWAPWEISRVALLGLTFFPTGTNVVAIPSSKGPLPTSKVTQQNSISWYKNASGDTGKYSADGLEGWFAHVSTDLLFVKKFPDVPVANQAPGEGDSEFYAGNGYEELEVQGPYQSLAAGASLTWTVRWYLRKLTDTSIATVGNAALATMVRDVVKQ
ncbi:MAG: DUF4380 domain-containing protein [Polyangiaceae bacterium]